MSMLVDAYRFGGGAGGDPYFSSVVSLMHFNGPGATTFTDQIGARTWTRVGSSLVISSAQSMFGGYSLDTGAESGNYLYSDTTSDFAFGTGDFTIEFWHRTPSTFPSFHFVADWRSAGSEDKPCIFIQSQKVIYYVAGAVRITGATTLSAGTWYHIAISRVGGTTRLFVDGALDGTWSDSTNYVTARCALNTAGDSGGAFGAISYMDDLRVTKGVGRYSSAFTPPSAQFPDS